MRLPWTLIGLMLVQSLGPADSRADTAPRRYLEARVAEMGARQCARPTGVPQDQVNLEDSDAVSRFHRDRDFEILPAFKSFQYQGGSQPWSTFAAYVSTAGARRPTWCPSTSGCSRGSLTWASAWISCTPPSATNSCLLYSSGCRPTPPHMPFCSPGKRYVEC